MIVPSVSGDHDYSLLALGRDPARDSLIATISGVKIRAVTLGVDLPAPRVEAEPFHRAAEFLREARNAFQTVGLEVQTTRIAGPELGSTLSRMDLAAFTAWAAETEATARSAGVDYLSLGRVPGNCANVVERIVAPVLAAGEVASISADLIADGLPRIEMAVACARAVRELSAATPQGFGSFRFAATANCPANIPFLPAAYHCGGEPRFSVAVQAADVVLEAVHGPGTLEQIEERLVTALEGATRPAERVGHELAARFGYPFVGIDLSPAPAPGDDVSIAGAVEAAGVERFGAPGTVYLAAMITRAIRRTRISRSGFSGLMLPVLEDSVLARRMSERHLSVHELLLYSSVCGTGLDTVPLPGDVSEAELAGIYLDVAALSVALGGKPLTVRLLPVPGSSPGDPTTFTFEYFHNTRVPAAANAGIEGKLARSP
jgi:uncharacterized protein